MSADNAIVVARFTTEEGGEEFRIAHVGVSGFECIDSHYLTPEEARDEIHHTFGSSPVFGDDEAAVVAAAKLHDEVGYTEYGIYSHDFDRGWNDLRDPIDPPTLPEGACPHCSHAGSIITYHDPETCDSNPENPVVIVYKALQDEGAKFINERYIARVAVEALQKAGRLP